MKTNVIVEKIAKPFFWTAFVPFVLFVFLIGKTSLAYLFATALSFGFLIVYEDIKEKKGEEDKFIMSLIAFFCLIFFLFIYRFVDVLIFGNYF